MKTNVIYESRKTGVQWTKDSFGKIFKRLSKSYEWLDSFASEFQIDLCIEDGILFEVKTD